MLNSDTCKKKISIILSSDEKYSIYLNVLLSSIAKLSNKIFNYEIFIMDAGITSESKKNIVENLKLHKNFSIQYINVEGHLDKYKDIFITMAHFTVATYARFFIPEILPNNDKVLYLDVDLLVNYDISELYNIDIENYIVGAAVDACYARQLYNDEDGIVKYTEQKLGLPEGVPEFNAGVLLINLKKWRNENLTQKCILKLQEIGTPRVLDQCVLNAVIPQKYLYNLPVEWNYVWHAELEDVDILQIKSKYFYDTVLNYQKKINNIKIVHYTSGVKPWNIHSSNPVEVKKVIKYLAHHWWSMASETPFFTDLILNAFSKKENNYQMLKNTHSTIKILGLPLFQTKKTEYLTEIKFLGVSIIRIKKR